MRWWWGSGGGGKVDVRVREGMKRLSAPPISEVRCAKEKEGKKKERHKGEENEEKIKEEIN